MSATENTDLAIEQEKYKATGGTRCPYCDSQNLSGDSIDIDAGGASQRIGCGDCNKEWFDQYILAGFDPIDA